MKLRSVSAHLPLPACKHMKHTHIYINMDRKKVGIFQWFLCNGFCVLSKHLDLLFTIEYYEKDNNSKLLTNAEIRFAKIAIQTIFVLL